MVKRLLDIITPRTEIGEILPWGFSITHYRGLVFKLPLPFRWREYCIMNDCEMWGNATLFISRREFAILWLSDREGPTEDDYRMNDE